MASGVSTSMALTLLGFCVSVLFIVFVCSRLVCALLRRPRSPRLPAGATATYSFAVQLDRHPAPASGLDPAAVAAFPTRAFSRGSPSSDSHSDSAPTAAQCVICIAEYEDKDVLRFLPYCGHNFHVACIDVWLNQHSTCPVCRISLRDYHYPDSKHTVPPTPSAVTITPSSPEASRPDPCHCLFVGTGHSPRASEVLRYEPSQANQINHGPSVDGENNNSTLSGVNSHGGNDNQTAK